MGIIQVIALVALELIPKTEDDKEFLNVLGELMPLVTRIANIFLKS
jgi:hypothetical protein